MKIDLDKIRKADLTIDQFLALLKTYQISKKRSVIDYSSDTPNVYLEMEKNKLIKLIVKDGTVNYILRKKGEDILKDVIIPRDIPEIPDKSTHTVALPRKERVTLFDEFWKAYPITDVHGLFVKTRTLKSNKPGCRLKYMKLLAEGIDHADILKALKYDVANRKTTSSKDNNLKYMKNSYAWLNQREFEVILESMSEGDVNTEDWTTNVV